ncbi:MAG TPA: serine/threonine-protein kinase [Bryobacteraceae bacterium]|nr:serine/threonine-protein kinase [Bryobacteraceae bacterium]
MGRIDQIEELFHQARAVAQEERAAWLESRCNGDAELCQEVASLLEANSEMRSSAPIPAAPDLSVPTAKFGAYRAVELLGRGGTSTVYRAERADGQFSQNVALKIMAAHLGGPEFLRRFEIERQLMATLNHNNITRLLDGGVSSNGDPYLLTEFVEGEPLDRYADSHKLDLDARLRLFSQVLEAVDYAHRNLIVHRDLKPANILVNTEGNVKLLDFGTASLLARPTDITLTRVRMMTPRYASPEQLKGERLNISTDIFSLGVVLYELLCGGWPFGDPNSVLSELNRITGKVAPTSLTSCATAEAAGSRSVSLQNLRGLLRGDLSTIVLKMLENEPARRYGSARQVAEDIERFREGRPILARPRTPWYATRKFVTRNWLPVSAASAAVLALAALTVFSVNKAAQAREEAARAQRVSDFVKNTFLSASSTWTSPLRGQSRAIEFKDVLDNAAERVGKELSNDPVAQADLLGTIGGTYSVLGNPGKGELLLRQALDVLSRSGRGASRKAADLNVFLCNAYSYQGRYDEALKACAHGVELARVYGSELSVGAVLNNTGFMAAKSGAPLAEAEKYFREAEANGPTEPRLAKLWPAINNTRIGGLRVRQGDLAEGERLLRDSERLLRSEPGPPIEILPTLDALAVAARIRGNYPEARRWLEEALELLRQRPTSYMGSGDQLEIELAANETLAGQPQGLSRFQKVSAAVEADSGAPVESVRFHLLAGIVESGNGLRPSAERHLRAALATSQKELARQPADRVEIYLRLAQTLAASGRNSEAADVAQQGLHCAESSYAQFFQGHPMVTELRKLGGSSTALVNQ